MFTRILIANRGEIACRIIRTAKRMGIAAAAAAAATATSPASATSCRVADAANVVQDVVSICWAGLDDRRIFDAARDRSQRYRPIDGLTRFNGLASLEYHEGQSCSVTFGVPPYRPQADAVVAGLSRELALARVESRFDPATLTRSYNWPIGNSAERGRRLEATLRFERRPLRSMRCEFDQMTVTVRNSSAS